MKKLPMITEAMALEAMRVIEDYVEQDEEHRSVMLVLYNENGGHVMWHGEEPQFMPMMLGFLNESPEMLTQLHNLLKTLEAEGLRTVRHMLDSETDEEGGES